MKRCSKCKIIKDTSCFAKHKRRKDGLHNECKECVASRDKIRRIVLEKELKEKSKNYYIQNKEIILVKAKEYRENNADKISDYQKKYATNNRQKLKKYLSVYIKKHRETNRDLYAAKDAKRRAAQLNALPKWLTKAEFEQIKELYTCAQMFKLYTGEEYHVDHIVPLQGENVCGLHVPWNLQVIPAKEI